MSHTERMGEGCGRAAVFPSTHWSVVLHAGKTGTPRYEAALEEVCQAYWYPLYAFVRRQGYPPEEAEDLLQSFFHRLIDRGVLEGLSREGGKFRSFLLTVLKRFLANQWHREHAQKRCGGKRVFSIDDSAEERYRSEVADPWTPETLFERQWALELLDRVLVSLRQDYVRAHKEEVFEALQGCLPGGSEELSYSEVGRKLGLGESAVRMAALRLRRRFGQLLRSEIAATVSQPEEIDEEIQYLMAVVNRP